LIDTGRFGARRLLIERLAQLGVSPADVTDVLLTHSHYDHSVNWTLFPTARIQIGATELDWALSQEWGSSVVPELYMRELESWPNVTRLADGDETLPSLVAHDTPGHTPGSMTFVLDLGEFDVVFAGDAVKNRSEWETRRAEFTIDAEASASSIREIHSRWLAREGSVLVPGHDAPLVNRAGLFEQRQRQPATVTARLDREPSETKFELKRPGSVT